MAAISADHSPGRIPTLDGWRGIAILMVLFTHAQKGLFYGTYRGYTWLDLGRHGVGIFFVLSGFLITSRLLGEDAIDLPRFYGRRFFRLMPVAWVYLLFLFVIRKLSGVHLVGTDALACLLFFRNFYPASETPQNAFTSHFWSLSIEEQFYLVWPAVLRLTGRAWAFRIACAACVMCAVYRWLHWDTYNQLFADTRTQVNFDGLLVGCLLALLLHRGVLHDFFSRFYVFLIPVGTVSMVWHITHYHELIPLSESLTIALLIGATSQTPSGIISRLLDVKIMRELGVYSYSLYMWQEFFLLPHFGILFQLFLPLVAITSWHWIEQPCIRLGRRLLRRSEPAQAPPLITAPEPGSLH
jgi:peptidoglycan/LPS O-acetylase OafA/YrhL